ncbi:hypothetical protein IQ269_13010 [Tychonema sp. LEGE 07199]|uniref:hypothetical protein n=1 Tax=unclassified Tychonema TaxID=2642144 RepID=UPI001882BB0D|nr:MULTISPECIES: hypothetical protein [unclassified Tychonema]MBE9121696.1 hypothetical protein [Tychonema sp. LEGE 07199]MBE9133960.1 hypothetical protein [Tychonema sp. LEGE 07196]
MLQHLQKPDRLIWSIAPVATGNVKHLPRSTFSLGFSYCLARFVLNKFPFVAIANAIENTTHKMIARNNIKIRLFSK